MGVLWQVVVSVFKEPKTRAQEQKYHAMIGDIAALFPVYGGIDVDADDWKRILVAAFMKANERTARVVPALEGEGVVILGEQTRYFSQEISAEFIEYLYAYGAIKGVQWSE